MCVGTKSELAHDLIDEITEDNMEITNTFGVE